MSGTRPCNSNGNATVNNLQPGLRIGDPNSRDQPDHLSDPISISQGLNTQNLQNVLPYTGKIDPADSAYWNNAPPPLSSQPFQPGNTESGPLPDAHYYHIVKDWPPADYLTKTKIPDPKYADQNVRFNIDVESLPEGVGRQSVERLNGSSLVRDTWKKKYSEKAGFGDKVVANSLRGEKWKSSSWQCVLSPHNLFLMYGEKEKPMTREGISEGFKKTPKDSDSSNPKGRPSVQDLKRVSESFQEIDPVDKDLELFSEGSKKFKTESEKNNRKRQSPRKTSAGPSGSLVGINKVNESENNPARFEECKESSDSGNREGQPQPKTAAGPSGSLWGLNQLNDLSCIPLFGMDMGIILPRGFDCAKVMNDIDKCYIVKRILNEVTVPSRNDLAQFNKTHMSWYLFNPWCLFFTALRDNLARRNPVIAEKQLNKDATQESESRIEDEDKDEPTSEGLLHRFMEVILLLFSILRGERDDWRSTPRRTVVTTVVGKSKCTIEDDGYVYLTRGGTTGHEESEETATDVNPPNRSRHGGEPVIRFEAKRMRRKGLPTAQIFAELLSAAVLNMEYLNEKVPSTGGNLLPTDLSSQPDKIPRGAEYHDSFVFHIEHYHLRIHTARFPTEYLKWVTQPAESSNRTDVIVQKVTAPYDLSKPDDRLRAARDILILLFAIRAGRTADPQGLFVARAVVPQTHKALVVPEPMNVE